MHKTKFICLKSLLPHSFKGEIVNVYKDEKSENLFIVQELDSSKSITVSECVLYTYFIEFYKYRENKIEEILKGE